MLSHCQESEATENPRTGPGVLEQDQRSYRFDLINYSTMCSRGVLQYLRPFQITVKLAIHFEDRVACVI